MPTGVVTFLFSDIEGSTQRWEFDRAAMDAAVQRHDTVLRDVVERHNGYVFKTIGDAFCVAFQSAPDAVAATCAAQRALAAEDFSSVDGIRVRMGLHTGDAEERNADYFGPTVNRVARLVSIGHGGQVLLSGTTYDHAHCALPTGASLVDLGLRRLKDLTQPEQVWQLTIDGLPNEFPPLKSLDARANNLPTQATTLLGREPELENVKTLIGQHRLLTLFGAGGVGKTRLALQVGADLLDRYADGVWFVDLAPIRDQELVASVIAKTIGLRQTEGQQIGDAIVDFLKRKHLLLILDNCEHVLEAVSSIASAIIGGCPEVRMLATSRQALGISGEAVHNLPSLAVPDTVTGLDAHDALEFGSVALFVERARAADTRFRLTDDTAPVIADICRRLDGIPLAIELAAARVKVLSIPNLSRRLNERFKILTGGSRTALPRQKTLVALIDWSYDLLAPNEQKLFNRLGIFAGGFSLGAATSVCGGDGLDENEVLDLLLSLTDKSLVAADTSGQQERFRLLESTRAYALEKSAAAGERDRLARKHAEYFRDSAQAADKRIHDVRSISSWLADVEPDLDNYRHALEWSLKDGHDAALGGTVAGSLGALWSAGGLTVEGRYWIDLAQAALDESAYPAVAARLWGARASSKSAKESYEANQRALALFRRVADRAGEAWALNHGAFALYQMGRFDEAAEAAEEALAAMRDIGNKHGEANCFNVLATIHMETRETAAARDAFAQSLAVARALEDEIGAAIVMTNLADLEFIDGRYAEALAIGVEGLETWLRGKDGKFKANGLCNTALYRIALEDHNGAREDAREALRWARRAQSALNTVYALQHLAALGALRGEVHDAARLIGYVDARFKGLGYEREYTGQWSYEKLMAALREQLSGAEIERLGVEGVAWTEDEAAEAAARM
ncbi:MAG TPA: adenylate/guanylate cyclase domain-containing protein [Candidatus Eremiobacteraceae bacterium]|nr:adenylate/guanylate cyclase domain-containing protein [Candidatus Eremiobacteraceae bacterium]